MAPAKESGTVSVVREGPRTTIQWEAGRANVLDTHLLKELVRSLRGEEVAGAHVVVLRGAGACWSCGLRVEDHLRPRMEPMLHAFREALRAIWDVPVPTLAQVHGRCLGGGLELLMACDLAIASDEATFAQPEIRLGVFAPFGVAFYPHLLGLRRTSELLFLGETLDAPRAASWGIVHRVVPRADLEAAVDAVARTLSGYRREALRVMKRTLHRTGTDPFAALEEADRAYREGLMAPEDAEEGLRAFLEKRPPVWKEG